MASSFFIAALLCFAIMIPAQLAAADTRCYDHQSADYSSRFEPAECGQQCTVTPFFSPDHSLDVYLDVINSAQESIDIFTPGVDSWSKCTHFAKECNNDCIGCSAEDMQNESFPLFPALLNVVHDKGIKIRLMTNDYTQPTCEGLVAPLDWFQLNGINVRFYQTTTFMHSKFMVVDKGKRTLISSVNWSHTSFMKNREAGVVLEDCSCSAIDLYQSVFEYDWENGIEYQFTNDYSSDIKTFITATPIKVVMPPSADIPGAYVTPWKKYSDVTVVRGYTSPDNALDTVMDSLQNVQSSLQIAIYQITDMNLCNQTLTLHNNGVKVSIIVSAKVVLYMDWKLAQQCYGLLNENGVSIRKALTKFSIAHQKYWIIDNKEVHLSTGNWSPSDFPEGSTFSSYHKTHHSVNRDLLVIMSGDSVVKAFQTVFEKDWDSGMDWEPKN